MEKEREILTFTKEEAKCIVYEDNEDFEIISDTIDDTDRWSENHTIVVQRVSDSKYFKSYYSQGLTEMQDESPYDNDDPIFTEVFPVEKTIIVYE